jgi:hypothetical protein
LSGLDEKRLGNCPDSMVVTWGPAAHIPGTECAATAPGTSFQLEFLIPLRAAFPRPEVQAGLG